MRMEAEKDDDNMTEGVQNIDWLFDKLYTIM